MQTKCKHNATQMQTKCKINANIMQNKCKQNGTNKIQHRIIFAFFGIMQEKCKNTTCIFAFSFFSISVLFLHFEFFYLSVLCPRFGHYKSTGRIEPQLPKDLLCDGSAGLSTLLCVVLESFFRLPAESFSV